MSPSLFSHVYVLLEYYVNGKTLNCYEQVSHPPAFKTNTVLIILILTLTKKVTAILKYPLVLKHPVYVFIKLGLRHDAMCILIDIAGTAT